MELIKKIVSKGVKLLKNQGSSEASGVVTYPVVKAGEDAYEVAYKWGWESGLYKELIYFCYKTPDYESNARRFFESTEFTAVSSILRQEWSHALTEKTALDFACGNGIAAYSLARLGFVVTAMDSSVSELAGIRAAEKINGLDGAHFSILQSKSEGLPFADGTFDLVWIREALHHMKDLGAFLKEVYRVLKPGGIALCLREQVIWNEEQRKYMYDHHPFYPITKDEGCYYLKEYVEGFEYANFKLKKVLDPSQSPINYYPAKAPTPFDAHVAHLRKEGWDTYSFVAQK